MQLLWDYTFDHMSWTLTVSGPLGQIFAAKVSWHKGCHNVK
jgi:hypothetical protein